MPVISFLPLPLSTCVIALSFIGGLEVGIFCEGTIFEVLNWLDRYDVEIFKLLLFCLVLGLLLSNERA